MRLPSNGVVTQGFSTDHPAVDVAFVGGGAASYNTPLFAPMSGRVTHVGQMGARGTTSDAGTVVQITSGVDVVRVCHMIPDSPTVAVGQQVSEGDLIGRMGWSGYVRPASKEGTHAHVVMERNGRRVDIRDYVTNQGGDMSQQSIDESDIGVLRIAHSEIGGWGLNETHAGKHDQQFLGAWRGKSYGDLIWGQWSAGAKYRDAKQAQLAFFNKYSAIIADLEARPTKAQLDKALADLAAEAANVKVVEKTVYTHDEATAQAVRDNLKTTKSVQGSLSNFIGWVKNKLGR